MLCIKSWCKSWLSASFFIFAVLLSLAPSKAFADTYQIFNLGTDGGVFFYGMDDSGNVALYDLNGAPNGSLYLNFYNGVLTGTSVVTPTFTADNGIPCSPSLPVGTELIQAVCNNGQYAFDGRLDPQSFAFFVYAGPDNIPLGDGGAFIYMNGMGDVVFDDEFGEYWLEAVDLTTTVPEPGSMLLVSTGLLAAFGRVRQSLH